MTKRKLTDSQRKTLRAKRRRLHPTSDRKEFSTKVFEVRQRMNMTQREFARQLDVSARTVERWESWGHHMPRGRVLKRFDKFYGLNMRVEINSNPLPDDSFKYTKLHPKKIKGTV